jgi:hypothetical protein
MNLAMKKLLLFPRRDAGRHLRPRQRLHTPRSDLVVRVETCEAILREFMANPNTAIPPGVWQRPAA